MDVDDNIASPLTTTHGGGWNAEPRSSTDASHTTRMQTRSLRRRNLVQHYHDYLPEGPGPLVDSSRPRSPSPEPEETRSIPATEPLTSLQSQVPPEPKTSVNTFGLYRKYTAAPDNIPDDNMDVTDVTEVAGVDATETGNKAAPDFGLFGNLSTMNFYNWFWTGGTLKSVGERDRLVKEVFHSPEGFNPLDIQVPHLHKLDKQLSGQATHADSEMFSPGDNWIEKVIEIPIPDGVRYPGGEKDAPKFPVPRFYHRKLTEVIRAVFSSPAAKNFHYTGYKQFWKSPDDPSTPCQRVFDEVYSADSFLAAEEEILSLPPEPNCNLPRAVAGLMFASDGLKLADFGSASLWPGYAYFANQTKWERAKPRAHAAHHVAYFPKVN
jgi:Plavaka transposase